MLQGYCSWLLFCFAESRSLPFLGFGVYGFLFRCDLTLLCRVPTASPDFGFLKFMIFSLSLYSSDLALMASGFICDLFHDALHFLTYFGFPASDLFSGFLKYSLH